jgi:hypothetical protein
MPDRTLVVLFRRYMCQQVVVITSNTSVVEDVLWSVFRDEKLSVDTVLLVA